MAEPFLYGVIVSLISKLETSYDAEVIPVDIRVELKEKLTLLPSALSMKELANHPTNLVKPYDKDAYPTVKDALYKADELLDHEGDDLVDALWKKDDGSPISLKRDPQFFSTLNRVLGFILGGKEINKGILSHLSTELSEFLPEKIELADVGIVSCFAYCALYPKGHTIIREVLVNQWMAEGFLSITADEELEDVGNRYFSELFRRGTFQDPVYAFGSSSDHPQAPIYSCVMHPRAHDDACRIAAQEVQALTWRNELETSLPVPGNRYLSLFHDGGLQSSYSDIIYPLFDFNVRTYLLFAKDVHERDILFDFKLPSLSMETEATGRRRNPIRVLDLSGVQSRRLPTPDEWLYIGAHLRYLSLPLNRLTKNVAIQDNFKYLQTLDLHGCTELDQLVVGSQFTRLRHLYLTSKQKTLNLSGLTTLRILELSHCRNLRILTDDIKDMTALTTLRIFDCPQLILLPNNMDCLTRIEELVFHYCPLLILTYGRYMRFINSLPNLRRLELIGLHTLDELPVWLQYATALQYFMIADCQTLTTLTDVVGNLTSLERFYIYKCPKLSSLPEVIRNLARLQSLHIRGCPGLIDSKKGYYSHIPDIILEPGDFQDQVIHYILIFLFLVIDG